MKAPSGLTVGVTGHRMLAELDKVEAGIEAALQHIEKAHPGAPLTVLSALAEGADRLVAHRVLARPSARLVAVLPLAAAEYLKDFRSADSRAEFDDLMGGAERIVRCPAATTRTEAYERAGDYVVAHCDVLVAVWDGSPAQGQAGTGAVVERARERKLPIAWVHAGNRQPGTDQPTSLGEEQGVVTFENFARPALR